MLANANKKIGVFMKRALSIAALCVAVVVFAGAETIGLTAGIEFGFGNVADTAVFGITPEIEYEKSFGAFDVYADASYTAAFEEDDTAHDFYLELEGAYNLSIGSSSVLSFIVNNANDFHAAPDWGGDVRTVSGTVEPAVKFTQTFGSGDMFLHIGFPIEYAHQEVINSIDETGTAAKLLIGMADVFGFGAELTLNFPFSPEAGYGETELLVTYENGTCYGEVDIVAAQDFTSAAITPEFAYTIKETFTVYVNTEFGNIGGEGDVSVTPALGVKYHF
jgi:hypothetical protein